MSIEEKFNKSVEDVNTLTDLNNYTYMDYINR